MRNSSHMLLAAAGLLAMALSAGAQLASRPDESTLPGAIAAGKVTATFTGTGASSGDAIRVTVHKTAAARPGMLTLDVPPGMLLRSSNPSEQDMVIAGVRGPEADAHRYSPQSQFVLADDSAVTYVLEAYCAEFHKNNPSPSTTFSVSPNPQSPASGPLLSAILTMGKTRNLSPQALQAAIWIATDNVTREEMNARLPITETDWQAGRSVAELFKSVKAPSADRPRAVPARTPRPKAPTPSLPVPPRTDSNPPSAAAAQPTVDEVVAGGGDPEPLRSFTFDDPRCVAFSPDGNLLVCGGLDTQKQGTLMVWGVRTGQVVKQAAVGANVGMIAFSRDGKWLAVVAGDDQNLRLYDAATWGLVRTLVAPTANQFAADFAPDGQTIAGLCGNKEVVIFDTQTGTVKRTLTGASNSMVCLAFSPDGNILATGGIAEVRLWDPGSGRVSQTITLPGPRKAVLSLGFSPDGKTLAGGCNDQKTRIWSMPTGSFIREFGHEGHHENVSCVRYSPDGKILATRYGKGFSKDFLSIVGALASGAPVFLWDPATGNPLVSDLSDLTFGICLAADAYSMAFSPDSNLLVTAGGSSVKGDVNIWEVRDLLSADTKIPDQTSPATNGPASSPPVLPDTQLADQRLAEARNQWDQRRYSDAIAAAREALALKRKSLPGDHPEIRRIQDMIQAAEAQATSAPASAPREVK